MSEGVGSEPQFERMEPVGASAASTCASCQRTIPDTYFEAGGKIFCPACKEAVAASMSGGSRVLRLVKAGTFGTLAAALSAAAWYGITRLTGYQLGIVAVVVGLVVGGAVRVGAERRGGWLYQTLAVLLTYLAIATSYVPLVMEGFREEAAKQASASADQDAIFADGEQAAEPDLASALADADPALVLAVAVFASLTIPVAQVADGGIIGFLIVCFALFEAWKVNRRQNIDWSGPFRLQGGPCASPA
jgi:hypothetical protein